MITERSRRLNQKGEVMFPRVPPLSDGGADRTGTVGRARHLGRVARRTGEHCFGFQCVPLAANTGGFSDIEDNYGG